MQKDIQKAAIISSNDFNYKQLKRRYDIVYVGSEFCQNLLPSEEQIREVVGLEFKKIVIFIPFLTQPKFKECVQLITKVAKKYSGIIEVSTSDFGILTFLNRKFPQIPKNISRPLSFEFVRMKDEILKETVRNLKINAIETDEEIFIKKLIDNDIKVHFHVKFAFVAMQRHCAFRGEITSNCNRLCVSKEMKLTIPEARYVIITRNNVYLKKIQPKSYRGISRLIYWL